ncbi:hypothetical protein [Pontimicrobium sp. SW4]|uniref:Uncharacterized protein n=1 Tax=Pontimicrobium sp. SW4 TaxID=3153519 RepID=A0AAU7BPE9_9FLAO
MSIMRFFGNKNLLFSFFFCHVFVVNSQEITKEHFKQILANSYIIINYLEKKDIDNAELYLKLSPSDAKKLKISLSNGFNIESARPLPYFLLTDTPNKFNMVITGFDILDKVDNEEYPRGDYYFVIRSEVVIDVENQVINFIKSDVITSDDEINKWWLSRYKTYVDKTLLVRDKYGFVPPPPPLPPKNLK